MIVIGAIGGTLFTHYVTRRSLEVNVPVLGLIGLFAFLGILLSVFINYWLVNIALRPLRELGEMVDQVQAGRARTRMLPATDADPDVWKLAVAVDSMRERLERRTLQLRALSQRVIDAQEEERKRIARGLHDDSCQALSRLIIDMERLEAALPADAPDLQRRMAAERELAIRTLDDLRNVVHGLRPTVLDDLGLAPAIRWYARSSLEEAGINAKFDSLEEITRLRPQLEITLFRIAQEAINNVVRHADAQSVDIGLHQENGHVCLWVEDDGRGFDVAQITGQALRLRRLGLLGIQERANLLDGEVTVDSAPGRGTRLQVRVPLFGMRDTDNG